MPDASATEASELDPGLILFDYFDGDEILELADQLGVALPIGTAIEDQSSSTGAIKLALSALGGELGRGHAHGETRSYGPASRGRTLVALLAELRARLKLVAPDPRSPSLVLEAAKTADQGVLIVTEGWWQLNASPLAVRLTHLEQRSSDRPEPVPDWLDVSFRVPGSDETVLTSKGQARFAQHGHVFASVLGHGPGWDDDEQRFTGWALAVFHRQAADAGFRWRGMSLAPTPTVTSEAAVAPASAFRLRRRADVRAALASELGGVSTARRFRRRRRGSRCVYPRS
jgi:hypothetical protein